MDPEISPNQCPAVKALKIADSYSEKLGGRLYPKTGFPLFGTGQGLLQKSPIGKVQTNRRPLVEFYNNGIVHFYF